MTDDGFMGRVYLLGALLWLAAAGVLAALGCWGALAGWTAGSAVSLGLTRVTHVVIAASFLPGMRAGKKNLYRLYLIKLPVAAVVLSMVIICAGPNAGVVVGLLCGVALTQISVTAEALRSWAAARSGSQ